MIDSQGARQVNLSALLNWLKEGQFVVPDFQREFEWEPADINALIRSIVLDYYIGSLLLWRAKPETIEALACEPLYAFRGDMHHAQYIVLDGQQRLTALYYACFAPYNPVPGKKSRYLYFIRIDRFMREEVDEAFVYEWTKRGNHLLADRTAQFEQHMFPLSVLGQGGFELFAWIQEYQQYWSSVAARYDESNHGESAAQARWHAESAKRFADWIRKVLDQYQVSYIELDRGLGIDKVCDIFTQINSRGVRLDTFDLINALLKPKGLQLKHLWRDAQEDLAFAACEQMNRYLLQVMSIRRQAYCSPKYLYYLLPGQPKKIRHPDGRMETVVLVANTDEFLSLWNEAVGSMRRSLEQLRDPSEFGAISARFLPYVAILPVFAALLAEIHDLPPQERLNAREKLRQWYWASVFSNRYAGSSESTAARDYQEVCRWFRDDGHVPSVLREWQERPAALDLRKETRSGRAIYNGVFNLLILCGPRDWIEGCLPKPGDIDDHHIVPASWGRKQGVGQAIDAIGNRTALTSETNRKVVRDRLPNVYLAELIERHGRKKVEGILSSHLITARALEILLRKPFKPEDYEAFLQERERAILQAIHEKLLPEWPPPEDSGAGRSIDRAGALP